MGRGDASKAQPLGTKKEKKNKMKGSRWQLGGKDTLVRSLPVAHLPQIPYSTPQPKTFAPESSGRFQKKWLRGIPAYRKFVENTKYLPDADQFWASSPSEAMTTMASGMGYNDILHQAGSDGLLPIDLLLRAADAPTPDLVYEDIMRWKMFDTIQKPPEVHFLLEPHIILHLLSRAAHLVLMDPDYFYRAEMFFKKMERQQNLHNEGYSSWVMICAASGRIEMALDVLALMDNHEMTFHPEVFVLMMNPGAHDFRHRHRGGRTHLGFVHQLRLHNRMSAAHKCSSVAIHALFVMYNLTLNHVMKWELLRHVIGRIGKATLPLLSPRTVLYVAEVLKLEGARRCGPLTLEALLLMYGIHHQASLTTGYDALIVALLVRVRQNEMCEAHLQMCPIFVVRPEVRERVLMALAATSSESVLKVTALLDNKKDDPHIVQMSSAPLKPLRLPLPLPVPLEALRKKEAPPVTSPPHITSNDITLTNTLVKISDTKTRKKKIKRTHKGLLVGQKKFRRWRGIDVQDRTKPAEKPYVKLLNIPSPFDITAQRKQQTLQRIARGKEEDGDHDSAIADANVERLGQTVVQRDKRWGRIGKGWTLS